MNSTLNTDPQHERSPAQRALWILMLAATLGLSAGFAEVSLVAVRKFLLGHYIMLHGLDVVWMSPLADGLLLLAAALPLALVVWLTRRPVAFKPALFLLVLLATLTVNLHLANMLELYAILLLSMGIAFQTCRLLVRHEALARRIGRVALPSLIVLTAALGLGSHAWLHVRERAAIRALPQPAQGAPNVLLVVLDTARAASLSLYGYHRDTTPFLRSLAAESLVFDRAVATAPWTLPSHASMFTGRFRHEFRAGWQRPLGTRHPTLAGVLRDRGYLTAGFVANTIYCSTQSGLHRGFDRYEDFRISPGQVVTSSGLARFVANHPRIRRAIGYFDLLGRKTAVHVNRSFLDWLDDKPDGRPFFAFLNYFDAHNPYLPPAPFDTRFGPRRPSRDPWLLENVDHRWSPAEVAAEQDAYDGALAWLDSQLQALCNDLATRGLLDNTILIITADHGEEFNEHGVLGHGNSLYFCSVHVPLLLRYPPGIAGGRRVNHAVSLRDIPRTVMTLAGHASDPFPGTPLTRFCAAPNAADAGRSKIFSELRVPGEVPSWFPIAKGDMKSVIQGDRRFILNGDGALELYDIARDAGELHDLATPQVREEANELLKEVIDAPREPQ